jgi:quercetin dioxygenase-like cupin family protein
MNMVAAATVVSLSIARAGTQPSQKGPVEYFTGTVRVDPLFQARESTHASGAYVTFEPSARTAWHTHPLGQTLVVTAGVGRVQIEGGPIEEIRSGDVVWIPPGKTPLAWCVSHDGDDPSRHPGAPQRQGRRVDGEGYRRAVRGRLCSSAMRVPFRDLHRARIRAHRERLFARRFGRPVRRRQQHWHRRLVLDLLAVSSGARAVLPEGMAPTYSGTEIDRKTSTSAAIRRRSWSTSAVSLRNVPLRRRTHRDAK